MLGKILSGSRCIVVVAVPGSLLAAVSIPIMAPPARFDRVPSYLVV
jgi:uncharacterized ion transporter superfamily protein YfcC